jgi:HprK-related kinase A
VKLADISPDEFRASLCRGGITIRTGPFVFQIRTSLPKAVEGIRTLYGAYPAEPATPAHFRVQLAPVRGLRRFLRPQVHFELDGEFPFYPFPRSMALPLFEWGLNYCVSAHCTDYLILHSAVVERGGKALLLAGQSGSGKSTLCAGLVLQGWRLLSDEMALIRLSDGRVQPFPRPVGLKDESIEIVRGKFRNAVLGPVSRDVIRGRISHMLPPAASVERALETAPVAAILFLTFTAGLRNSTVEPVLRPDAMVNLIAQSFNYSHLGTAGFEALAALVETTPLFAVKYGLMEDVTERLTDMLGAAGGVTAGR